MDYGFLSALIFTWKDEFEEGNRISWSDKYVICCEYDGRQVTVSHFADIPLLNHVISINVARVIKRVVLRPSL